MAIKEDIILIAGVGIAIIGIGWWAKNKIAAGASAVVDAASAAVPYVNPADSRNIAYTGVNSIGEAVTGNQDFSLGSWLYDVTH